MKKINDFRDWTSSHDYSYGVLSAIQAKYLDTEEKEQYDTGVELNWWGGGPYGIPKAIVIKPRGWYFGGRNQKRVTIKDGEFDEAQLIEKIESFVNEAVRLKQERQKSAEKDRIQRKIQNAFNEEWNLSDAEQHAFSIRFFGYEDDTFLNWEYVDAHLDKDMSGKNMTVWIRVDREQFPYFLASYRSHIMRLKELRSSFVDGLKKREGLMVT